MPSHAPGRRHLFRGAALVLACGLGLLAAEVALRLFPAMLGFERLAYLPEPLKIALGARFRQAYRSTGLRYFARHATQPQLVNTVRDPRYGIRLAGPSDDRTATEPSALRVDVRGFRNDAVPRSADLLFVGDSFTAGVSGAHVTSAPKLFATRVGQLLERSVYQAACYGWGPRQFALVTEDVAPGLRPRWVIVTTYLDNDLGDVWVYDGWKSSPFETYAEFRMYRSVDIRVNPRPTFLTTRSVLVNLLQYRAGRTDGHPMPASHADTQGAARYRTLTLTAMPELPSAGGGRLDIVSLTEWNAPYGWQCEFATPQGTHRVQLRSRPEDARSGATAFMQLPWWPPYAEALEATVAAIRGAAARPLIVLAPSRERVLAPFVAAADVESPWPYGVGVVPDGPARAVASLAAAVDADFVDLAPPLRTALASGTYGFADGDIHFNAAGHAIAADAIAGYIRAAEAAPAS